MSHDHSVILLAADAPQVGLKCPVKRVTFRPGEQIVLCAKTGEAISLEAYRENAAAWKGMCPLCYEAVEIQDGGAEPRPGKGKAVHPTKQTPVYVPTRQSTGSIPGWFWPAVAGSAFLMIIVTIILVSAASSRRTITASSTTIPTQSTSIVIATRGAARSQPSTQESTSPETTADPAPIPTQAIPIPPAVASSPQSQASVSASSPTGRVKVDRLNLRSGPGTEYAPPVGQLSQGEVVDLIGYNTARDGSLWRRVHAQSGTVGWVISTYLSESGCIQCVPLVPRPALPPTAMPTSRPASLPMSIASNRGDLLNQGQNGWRYQYEEGRDSGNLADLPDRRAYSGVDCYRSTREDYVRMCANGEIHPGQESRLAYRWESSYTGTVLLRIHAHKIDTRCGDGVWVGVFIGERNGPPSQLGTFAIGGGDNTGSTKDYRISLSTNSYLLAMVDIRGSAECDLTRLYIDVLP